MRDTSHSQARRPRTIDSLQTFPGESIARSSPLEPAPPAAAAMLAAGIGGGGGGGLWSAAASRDSSCEPASETARRLVRARREHTARQRAVDVTEAELRLLEEMGRQMEELNRALECAAAADVPALEARMLRLEAQQERLLLVSTAAVPTRADPAPDLHQAGRRAGSSTLRDGGEEWVGGTAERQIEARRCGGGGGVRDREEDRGGSDDDSVTGRLSPETSSAAAAAAAAERSPAASRYIAAMPPSDPHDRPVFDDAAKSDGSGRQMGLSQDGESEYDRAAAAARPAPPEHVRGGWGEMGWVDGEWGGWREGAWGDEDAVMLSAMAGVQSLESPRARRVMLAAIRILKSPPTPTRAPADPRSSPG